MSEYVLPQLRAQSTLKDAIEARLRDTANARFSEPEIYNALSDAVLRWSGRVFVPHVYTVSGGWDAGIYEYTLPAYLGRRMQPQRKVAVPYVSESASQQYVWADVLGWTVEPNATGGQTLRLQYNEGNIGVVADGRILYWGENGPLPSTVPTLQTTMTSSVTSLILSTLLPVGQSGFVYVEQEWMEYAGCSHGTAYTTLTNLVRGVGGTTAASHSSAVSVYFGVALPDLRLFENLYPQALANVYAYGLTATNDTDRERHERNWRIQQQLADEFWRMWTPNVAPRIKLSRRTTG